VQDKKKRRKRKTTRQVVFEKFVARGSRGLTDQELDDITPKWMSSNSTRPRRIDLVRDGLVKPTKQKRETRSGRLATVWVVKR